VRGLGAVTAVAAVLFGLFWCYLLQSRTQGADSDSAGQVLQGWDMVHGNLLLRGWVTSDVSFYTFEIPVDGLVAAVDGLRTDVIHIAASIEYALLVLFAALVAAGPGRDRQDGAAAGGAGSRVVRGLVAAGIMVAPGTWQGSGVLLEAPDHTAVGVPVLIVLLVVDRLVPRRWRPAAATLLLTFVLLVWAQLDDLVGTLSGAVPLAVVCGGSAAAVAIAAGYRRLAGPGRGRPGRPESALPVAQSPAYNAALAVLAVASFGVTELLVKAISHAGGFYLRAIPAGSQISHWATVPAQLRALAENLLILFGANFWGLPQPQAAIAYLHLICLALALVGLVVSIARWRTADRVTRALVVGIIVMLVAGAASPLMIIGGGTHEIAVVLPLGAALGGRVVGPWLATRAGSGQLARAEHRARATAAGVLAAAGLGLLCCLGYAAAQPARPPHDAAIADWLLAHHLTSGLGGYWNANITTLITGGEVRVAPVTSGGIYGYLWESKESWFDPHVSSANCIVTTTQQEGGEDVPLKDALAWYGKPAQSYVVGQYTVLVYNRNLLQTTIRPVPSQLSAPKTR